VIITCCYTSLHPKTVRSVTEYAPGVQFIDTSGDPMDYCRVLNARWGTGADLVTIEQDIEITPDVIPSFRRCKRSWCTFSYQGPPPLGYLYHGLGCTRFSVALQAKVPFSSFVTDGDIEWFHLDKIISRILLDLNIIPHVHGHLCHNHSYGGTMGMKYAQEVQPDGSMKLFEINPDGSRGRLVLAGLLAGIIGGVA
jgi:hypothetical protein